MRAMYNGRELGAKRYCKLPLPSPCDQTKLIPASADSASTVSISHPSLLSMTPQAVNEDNTRFRDGQQSVATKSWNVNVLDFRLLSGMQC
jgi:hypothetical protein